MSSCGSSLPSCETFDSSPVPAPKITPFTQQHERVHNSPLQVPLEIAVKKVVEGLHRKGNGVEWGVERVKEVLQQWMEGQVSSIERRIYSEMNKQMRRVVVKNREAQSAVRHLQQTINHNADIVTRNYEKERLEEQVKALQHNVQNINSSLSRSKQREDRMMSEIEQLRKSNLEMSARVSKYEMLMLREIQQKSRPATPIANLKSVLTATPAPVSARNRQCRQKLVSNMTLSAHHLNPCLSPLRQS